MWHRKPSVSLSRSSFPKHSRCVSSADKVTRKKHDYGGCVENVRIRDYEGYLHCLVFPEHLTRYAFAIRAFNLELAMVPDQARSDVNIAQMRYKFWKDSLDQIYKGRHRFHPTMMEVAFAVEKFELSKEYFERMIEARSRLLNRHSIKSFEEYALDLEQVYSGMNLLLVQLLKGSPSTDSTREAIAKFSQAQGILSALRGLRYLAARKLCEVPSSVLTQYSVNERDLFRLEPFPALDALVRHFCSSAEVNLNSAQQLIARSSDKAKLKLVTLPSNQLKYTLNKVSKANYDIFHRDVFNRNPLLPFIYKYKTLFLRI